jgi:hypothetical protein
VRGEVVGGDRRRVPANTSLERTAGGRSGGGKGWFAAAQLCR